MDRLKTAVGDLLPHRGGMLLIDQISLLEEARAVTRSRVNRDWPLVDGDAASPLVLIELVAQTGAICFGWRIRNGLEAKYAGGWLVGVKHCLFHIDGLPLFSEIETEVRLGPRHDNLREVLGTARMDAGIVGEMKLQVLLGSEEDDRT